MTTSTPTVFQAPTVEENPGFDVLYWVGCAGSYDRRAQRVTRAVVKLLGAAGVNFAVLGSKEKCTGEVARRLGDEFLFQELAQANIETLTKYKVRKVLTHCPHCFNSFRQDYPQLGGHYDVMHHTQFLLQLLREGRLTLPVDAPGAVPGPTTYHDPCYLARVNGIHVAPRDVLRALLAGPGTAAATAAAAAATAATAPSSSSASAASGCGTGCGCSSKSGSGSTGELREMARRETKTSCCGAGGGRMWMEEDPKQRVSTERAREALATGARTVAVGCPFCLTMMTDGVAAQGGEARVMDVAELLAERIGL